MKTIPAAMTWELLARGRWSILAAWLGAVALPGFILGALSSTGPIDRSDPNVLILYVLLAPVGMFVVATAVFTAQGPISKLYAHPVCTSTLVLWRMAPAMATVAVVSASGTAAINALFSLQWPIWPTALFLAVSVAAVQAVMWLTEKSIWIVAAITAVAVMLGLWLKSRYGPLFADPDKIWTHVTLAESLTMILMAIASYATALYGVGRNRRGESPLSVGFIDWIGQFFERPSTRIRRFSTPVQAQIWFQWQMGGWIMPACVVAGLLTGLIVWLFCSRDAGDLVYGLMASGGLLTAVGLVGGMLLGNMVNTLNGDTFAMGSFAASRPATNVALARAALHAAVKGVAVSWFIWAAAFIATLALLALLGELPKEILPPELGWRYFPLTILGLWLTVATLMTIGLAGRTNLFFQFVAVGPVVYIALEFASKWLDPSTRRLIDQGVAAAFGLALILGAIWLYALAYRRGMIRAFTAAAAACAWAAASATLILNWPLELPAPLSGSLFFSGILAVLVAPVAAAPLAIAWNRHR